jgi:hypothetical protein
MCELMKPNVAIAVVFKVDVTVLLEQGVQEYKNDNTGFRCVNKNRTSKQQGAQST